MEAIQRLLVSFCALTLLRLCVEQSAKVQGATVCSSPCLLLSNTTNILAIDPFTSTTRSIISGLTRAVAIDVHFSLGYIFWSDVTEQNIKRSNIDGTNIVTLISNQIGVCDGLAVEWNSQNLYWSDTTHDQISVADLNGNNRRILLSSGLDEPREIALDPANGLMFWTDWGQSPKIERASLSGSQRVAIVTTNLHWPNGIDIDRGNRRIFWVDAGEDRVESVDYNGNNRTLLYYQSGLHPFGIALLPPFLFFTDWNTVDELISMDATTGKVLRTYGFLGNVQPMGVVVYDNSRQSSGSSACSVSNGGCSHFCVEKPTGRECVCPTGIGLNADGKTCNEKMNKFLLFADADAKRAYVISLDVNYLYAKSLFRLYGKVRPIALDYDPVEDRVYFSDVQQGLIIRLFSNASSVEILFRCNVKNPEGLVIDHMGRNIYWTDTGTNRIEVARLDGRSRTLLFSEGLDEPRAIILDERNRTMYWTDWGSSPKIEQAAMDGTARRTIVTGNLGWPNGLTIDKHANRLYWVDAQLDKVEESDLSGGNRRVVVTSAANIHPYGLALYQGWLYWTDWNNQSISRLNVSSGKMEVIVSGLKKPMDIHLNDPLLTASDSNPCGLNNGFCSDLCLLKPGGYQCACPTGIVLKPDGRNCDYNSFHNKSADTFLLFADGNYGDIYKIPLAVPDSPCNPLRIQVNISRPIAVDYDPVEGKVYWTDVTLHLVARAFLNGSLVEILAQHNVMNPDGLAIDSIGRNLYWTDTGTDRIEVSRLDGSYRRGLITSNLDEPRSIILNIGASKMFWTDWGSSPKIEQANMDGTARTTLVTSGLGWPNSLALDFQNRLLYWCDAKLDKLERTDLQGNNRLILLDLSGNNGHPFGLVLYQDSLFWTDWNTKSIHRYNMTSSLSDVVVQGMGRPMGLLLYDSRRIASGSTSCSQLNGGCSHLCLANPNGHQCFCPDGVSLKPGDPTTCDGVNRCPQLSAPYHGKMKPCSNLPGQTCEFSCNQGYLLTGTASRMCSSNGVWTGTQPQCNVVSCPALSAPSHGIRQGCTGNVTENYNTVCLFSCSLGYNSSGSATRRCLQNGTWTGQDFVCQAVTCPSLVIPSHTVLLTPSCDNTYGTHCVFGCQYGYASTFGNISRTCLQSGQWSGNAINCTDVLPPTFGITCPGSPLLVYAERGRFSALVNWTTPVAVDNSGTTPTVTSNNQSPPQRMNQGRHVIIYTAKDTSGNTAICSFTIQVIVINCTLLDVPPGGPLRMSSCGNYYGATCSFSCASGFISNGSLTVTCVAPSNAPPGSWDNPLPTCQAVRCPSLPSPSNGVKTGCQNQTPEGHNTLCSFTCNPGYNLIGSSARRCLLNGTWSGRNSTCQAIECASLVPPQFGAVKPLTCLQSRTVYGGTCTFTCASGYTLEGTSSRVCGDRGEWTGLNDTRCKDTSHPTFNNTCPSNMVFYTGPCKSRAVVYWKEPVAVDTSGTAVMTYPAIRPSVSLTVGLYYILYSASDKNGNTANCSFIVQVIRKSCPSLQPPLHGDVTSLSCGSYYGSQAYLTCHPGYRLTGSRSRSCEADRDWSGNTTICDAVKCAPIKEPSNGRVFPGPCKSPLGVYYRTECYFMCDASNGYRLEGPNNVTCHDSGTWSADTNKSVCQDIQPPIIQCPPNMEVATDTGQSYANESWIVPVPTDNSKEALNVSGSSPPQQFNVGRTTVKYTVTDSAGLWSSCIFVVHVKDTEPPKFSSCPSDIRIMSGKRLTKIILPPAAVTDNVGVHLFVTNIKNGSELRWGEHNVTYTATDKAGNTATCAFHVSITDFLCKDLPAPLNGAKACETWLEGMHCTVHCNQGYGFAVRPQLLYICSPSGKWHHAGDKKPLVPDCSKVFIPQGVLVNAELHYLAGDCSGEDMNEVIASNFIELFMSHIFGKMGGCYGNEKCKIENVQVECGAQTPRRRRRETRDDRGSPLVELTVHFALKVPLPSNSSKLDFNETSQKLSDEIMVALNQTNLDLNISGVIIQLDRSSPPVISLTRLLCENGQVQRNTECVNCAVGYFYNASGDSCQACAVDHYQNKEAQTSCVSCPAQKSTFGRKASRWPQDCRERTHKSETETQGNWKVILISVVVSVVAVAIVVVLALLRKFYRRINRENSRTSPNHGFSNDAYILDDLPSVSEA